MNELDDKFKQALEGYTELPSPQVWDRISAALDEEATATAAPAQPAMRVSFRRRWIAVASIAATLALVVTTWWPTQPAIDKLRDSQIVVPSAPELAPEENNVSAVETTPTKDVPEELLAVQTPAKSSATPLQPTSTREAAQLLTGLGAKGAVIDLAEAQWDLATVDAPETQHEPALDDAPALWIARENISQWAAASTDKIGHWMGKSARQMTETTAKTVGKGVYNWELAKQNVNQTLATILIKQKTPNN